MYRILRSTLVFACLLYQVHESSSSLITDKRRMAEAERIVGGTFINITQVPYIVSRHSLYKVFALPRCVLNCQNLSFQLEGNHACGAAIINIDWGVTAAHCATAYNIDPWTEITIRSGSSFQNEGGVVHNIIQLYWHEKFNSEYSDYDVAVFKVQPSFEMSDTTAPINLPPTTTTTATSYQKIDDSWGIVVGWGQTSEFESVTSKALRYVAVPKVTKSDCVRDYFGRFVITPRQVCYGFEDGGKDSCKGDSGGPLVNHEMVLIGITSWGDGCGERHSPGVYTDVVLLGDWIRMRITTGIVFKGLSDATKIV